MDENQPDTLPPPLAAPPPGDFAVPEAAPARKAPIGLIIGLVLVVAILITGTVLLLRTDIDTTARIRDVFIIFMALESLVIGVALVVLIVQLATLINLLNNEIRPIINSTNQALQGAGFPGLGKYCIFDLVDGKLVVLIPMGDYAWGMLVDGKKAQLGLLLNVALPKAIAAFEDAITSN